MVYWTIGTDESAKTELMVEDRVIATLINNDLQNIHIKLKIE
jgi:hypothetical protein